MAKRRSPKIDIIKEACIFVFFIVLIIIRHSIDNESVFWITIVNCIAVGVSLIDLFFIICRDNNLSLRIKYFIIMSVFIALVCVCVFGLICTKYIILTAKDNDILTLTALLLALCKNFINTFITWIFLK